MAESKTQAPKAAGAARAAAAQAAPAAAAGPSGLDRVIDVSLRLSVEIGSTKLLLRDVLQLGKGSVVELDRDSEEPADLYVNGRLIGRGEVTSVDDRLAVRIVELVDGDSGGRKG